MKTLKKLIVAVGLMGVMSPSLPAAAQEIGDKMPDIENGIILAADTWIYQGIERGAYFLVDVDGDFQQDYTSAHIICYEEISEKPFAIYNGKTQDLYIDSNMDGIVDYKLNLMGKPRAMGEDAPNCPTKA